MKRTFFSALVFYLFAAAILFPYVRWYADNPDTFQYLAITKKYISGDWSNAVNGYWSPMISWLLVVPLLICKDGLLAFKILQLLIGVFVLFQWHSLIQSTTLQNKRKEVLTFFIIPFILDYALLNATPDLLFMGILFLLMNMFIERDFYSDRRKAITIGFTGCRLYLTKAFGFPFFVMIVISVLFFELRKKTITPGIRKGILTIFGVFILTSAVWILILSSHYNKFTISEAPRFNLSHEAAPLPGRQADLPILGKGLNAPQPHSFSAWETPGDYVSNETVTLFNSPSAYIDIIKRNLLSVYYFDFRNQAGMIFLLLMVVFLFRNGYRQLLNEKWAIIALLFIFFVYGGYSLILVHSRYTWVNNLLMVLLATYFIESIFSVDRHQWTSSLLFAFIIILAVKRPLKEILFTSDKQMPLHSIYNAIEHPFETLQIFYRPDANLQKTIEEIQKGNILNGNVASLKINDPERDSYTNALRISTACDCRYFGQLDYQLNPELQTEELFKNKIDFLITWKNMEWGNRQPLYFNAETGVRVYRVN